VAVEGGVVGRALGIDPRGRLSLETGSGEIRAVVAGSVVPLFEADEVGSSGGSGRR
jgi:hypothetical protein